MWIFTSRGFLSVVQKENDPATLVVRSRFPGHIQFLFADARVLVTPNRDYLYRAEVPRSQVIEVLHREAEAIDYDNFKDSVREGTYHTACSAVWLTLYRHQK